MELVLAGFPGFTLAGTGGMMFRHQVREYLDIREQARVQASLKLALQSVTMELANAGALLANPRESFAAKPARFSFACQDLTGCSCPAGTKDRITYRSESTGQSHRIVQDIACEGRSPRTQDLATVPRGRLRQAFRYYDKRGAITPVAGQVKALDLEISLQAGTQAGMRALKTRAQTVSGPDSAGRKAGIFSALRRLGKARRLW